MRERPRLARRPEDGMIAGVAAGVAETYGIDVTLVRLAFVAVAVMSAGTALVAYLLAAVLMPREDDTPGIKSVRRGVDDLVTRGRTLYDETRKVIDRDETRRVTDRPGGGSDIGSTGIDADVPPAADARTADDARTRVPPAGGPPV